MIAQKGRPLLCRLGIPRRFSHPAQHSSLRNIKAKHFHLTVNSRCAPGRILRNHAEDEITQFPADAPSSHTGSMPRKPRPIQLEPRSVPANDSLWLDEDQSPLPSRPEPPQDHPKQFVPSGKSRLRMPLLQNAKLLPQCQILQDQAAARGQEVNSQYRKKPQQTQHEISFTRGSFIMDAPFNYLIRRQIVILASHTSWLSILRQTI
jgi:hypothetical protein